MFGQTLGLEVNEQETKSHGGEDKKKASSQRLCVRKLPV